MTIVMSDFYKNSFIHVDMNLKINNSAYQLIWQEYSL